jgi:hypothetical protein
MPAAVAVPLIIGAASAGAQAYGAKKQADAAKGAARDQQAAGDRALAANQAVYQDQRSMMAPYVQAGQSSASALGRLLAPPAGSRYAAAPLPALGPGPFAGGNTAMPRPEGASGGRGAFGAALGGGGGFGAAAGSLFGFGGGGRGPVPEALQPMFRGRAGQAPPMAGQGGSMVTLRAPDGSTQAVPVHLAQQFISRGAVPVQ